MKSVAVIPAYNEEKTVRTVCEKTSNFVDKIIVVDDGSRDKTSVEAKKANAKVRVEVVILPENRGKAHALKAGFKLCKDFDVVVILDADMQHLPEEIPHLIKCIEEGADLCIGSRFLKGIKSMPLPRVFSNKVASKLISFLIGQEITDPQSGFRAIRREKLDKLDLKAERYAIEHIMILEAAKKDFKIEEVPISSVYAGEKSHVNVWKDTLRVAYYILRFLVAG